MMRKTLVASVGLATLLAVLAPALASDQVIDPPGEPRRLSPELDGHSSVGSFDMSPGGDLVRFSTGGTVQGQWIVPVIGGEPQLLAEDVRCSPCFWVQHTSLLVVGFVSTGEFGVIDGTTGSELFRLTGLPLGNTADGGRVIYEADGWLRSLDPRNPGDTVQLASTDAFGLFGEDARSGVVSGPLVMRKTLTDLVDGVPTWRGEELWTVDTGGGEPVKLLGGDGIRLREAITAPNGRSVAVAYFNAAEKLRVGWATVEGKLLMDRGFGAKSFERAEFSPDSRWVVVHHDSTKLTTMSRSGRLRQLVTAKTGHYWVISPPSSMVLFTHLPPQGDHVYEDISWFVYSASMDGTVVEQLTFNREDEDDRFHKVIAIAHDGEWLVFLDETNYHGVVSRMPLRGGERVDLVEEDIGSYYGRIAVTEDEKRLVWVGGDRSAKFVLSVPIQGGSQVNLIPDSVGKSVRRYAITPDSERVVFIARYRPTASELWVVDVGHRCADEFATLVGGPGPDVIDGTSDRDVIVGLAGNDVINGHERRDVICGGDGDDVLMGRGGRDILLGQTGADVLIGNAGRDTLRGHSGDDVLRAGVGDDILVGGLGADEFFGGPGFDRCTGDEHDIRFDGCEEVYPPVDEN